uniref:Peptidase_M14 domain-containing protein n=1 Tax=Macrostomum lignano TaxID=282301 RepID=A0A1I8JKC0_9PLAT
MNHFQHCIVLLGLPLLFSVATGKFAFDGFRHYRLSPMSARALSRLRWLETEFPAEPDPLSGLMFLTRPGRKFASVDVLVPPGLNAAFLNLVQATSAMRMQLIHKDYGSWPCSIKRTLERINKNSEALKRRRREADGGRVTGRMQMNHNFYRSYAEIRRSLIELKDRCNELHPGTCSLERIGRTFEGRRLFVLKIAKNKSPDSSKKTAVWLDAGIHAREWVSRQLRCTLLTSSLMWACPPNRMWRKNREVNGMRRYCRGVDLNRNYGYRWGGGAGSSGFPCADNFRGPAAFSAAETSAVRRYLESRKSRLLMFVSLHSFGQYLLIPYGYQKNTYSKTHHEKMMCAATLAVHKMFAINDRFYALGTGSDMLYEANGGSDDWAHGSLGVPYSFTVELPDEGDYGFLLPGYLVPSVGREAMRGLGSLLSSARRLEGQQEDAADSANAQPCNRLMQNAASGN